MRVDGYPGYYSSSNSCPPGKISAEHGTTRPSRGRASTRDVDAAGTSAHATRALGARLWREHSCLPQRDSSRCPADQGWPPGIGCGSAAEWRRRFRLSRPGAVGLYPWAAICVPIADHRQDSIWWSACLNRRIRNNQPVPDWLNDGTAFPAAGASLGFSRFGKALYR